MRTLIVLGASVRAAAFSALRAGFCPYGIDLFADCDLAAICPAVKIANYPHDFLEALSAAPDAPWIYTGGLENYPRLVARLAKIRPLLGNPCNVLKQIRDPHQLADAAHAAGLAFPPSKAERNANRTWLLKPRRGSGGHGIRLATAGEMARPPRGMRLSQFIDGQAASAVYVAAGGRGMLLGTSLQLLGRDFGLPSQFLYAGSIAPLELTISELAGLQALGDVLVSRFKLIGLFNVDLVRTDNKLWVLEANPRYSASVEVLERVTCLDSIYLHVRACEANALVQEPLGPAGNFAGKAIVYADADAVVALAFDRLIADWNRPGQPIAIADLPRVGDRVIKGHPVATVFATGNSLVNVKAALHARVSAVKDLLTPDP